MKRSSAALVLALCAALPAIARGQQPAVEVKAAPAAEPFTPEARAAVEAQVLEATRTVIASAYDFGKLSATMSKQPGLCLFQSALARCSVLAEGFRQRLSPDNPRRVVRSEVDGEELQAVAVSPTVAVVGVTSRESRLYRASGEVLRGRYTHLLVFILEDGRWRLHSATQSSWPIAP